MTRSLRQRVLAGSGANAFGQAVTIAIQLFSLPLFLHYWDAATYGAWLILSAIPSYLSMADAGMVTAAGNKMTIAMGQDDPIKANKVFQSALLFMLMLSALLSILVFPAALWMTVPGLAITPDDRIAVAALSGGVLLTVLGGLTDSVFKATGRYPLGTLLSNFVRLGEWGGAMLGLMFMGSFSAVAIGGLLARAVGLIAVSTAATRGKREFSWSVREAKMTEVRAMVEPALSFTLFPLAFALSFQGVTLMIGHMLGSPAVAIFNTYRTLARVTVQATSIFSHALWPEFSRLYGVGGASAAFLLYRRVFRIGAVIAFAAGIALYFAAPYLLQIWTHGSIAFDRLLMLAIMLYAVVGSAGHLPRVFLMATNDHAAFAICMLVTAAATLALASLLGNLAGLRGISVAMFVGESAITLAAIWMIRKALQSTIAPAKFAKQN